MKLLALLVALVAANPNELTPLMRTDSGKIITSSTDIGNLVNAAKPKPGMSAHVMNSGVAVLGGVVNALFFPITPTPDEVYNKMWGLIQNQVSGSILAKNKAQLTQSLSTLTTNINQQLTGYLSQLHLLGQTQESINAILARNGGVLTAPVNTVDTFMTGIDTILSASLDWYNPLTVDLARPNAFVLASASKGICLHTKDFRIEDGTELVADNECDLNNLADKMFSLDKNNKLLMRTQQGLKCVTYNDKKGTNLKKHMAIFSVNSRQCQSGKNITLHPQDGGFSMFDGLQNMLCIGSGKGKKNLNVIVTRQKGNKCKDNGLLIFDTMIPVILNDPNTGGVTGSSIVPSRSFEELGIQLYYFTNIATVHLLALKELYNFGSLKAVAKTQFERKIANYKDWLEKAVPVFTAYAKVMNIDATAQLDEANQLYQMLGTASLKANPVMWNPPAAAQQTAAQGTSDAQTVSN